MQKFATNVNIVCPIQLLPRFQAIRVYLDVMPHYCLQNDEESPSCGEVQVGLLQAVEKIALINVLELFEVHLRCLNNREASGRGGG